MAGSTAGRRVPQPEARGGILCAAALTPWIHAHTRGNRTRTRTSGDADSPDPRARLELRLQDTLCCSADTCASRAAPLRRGSLRCPVFSPCWRADTENLHVFLNDDKRYVRTWRAYMAMTWSFSLWCPRDMMGPPWDALRLTDWSKLRQRRGQRLLRSGLHRCITGQRTGLGVSAGWTGWRPGVAGLVPTTADRRAGQARYWRVRAGAS